MSIDLTTQYLGLTLKNPLLAAACPLTGHIDSLQALEAAGVGAVVLPSLFEEQIEHEHAAFDQYFGHEMPAFSGSLPNYPAVTQYNRGPDEYLDLVEQAASKLSIPVIGSLNGTTNDRWIEYAIGMEAAGADALELNVYYIVADPALTATDVESRYLDLVAAVRSSITIPLAVKLGPYFTALPNMARRLEQAGADGLVLFNRFVQPDINISTSQLHPRLALSTRDELRLPLRWIAILHGKLKASLAASSGIHSAEDVVKVLLAGADVATSASALLKHGPGEITNWLHELESWLDQNDHTSVAQIRGRLSQQNCADPDAIERSNYMQALTSFSADPTP